jgi:hypothetical protein
MTEVPVSYLAVFLGAVSNMILGGIWYSPLLFAKPWMRLIGKTEEDMKKTSPGKAYGMMFIAALVTAYVLAHFVNYANTTTVAEGIQAGFWAWLGFIATSSSAGPIFEGKPWQLYFIFNGYQVIAMMVMGAILAVVH